MWIKKLIQTLEGIFKILLLSKTQFKAATRTRPQAVVIGNGPTLTGMIDKHLKFLSDKEIFAVNYFALSDDFILVRPNHYVIVDFTFYYTNLWDEETSNKRDLFWKRLLSMTSWEMHLYLPGNAKKELYWKNKLGLNKNIIVHYFNVTPINGFSSFKHYVFYKMLGMPRPHNVGIPSLMIAIKMNFQKIYLWGFEHSWLPHIHVDDNNVTTLNNKHFYDNNNSKPSVLRLKTKPQAHLHELLFTLAIAFEGYIEISGYAKSRNVEIINQTRNSMIDAFIKEYLPDSI